MADERVVIAVDGDTQGWAESLRDVEQSADRVAQRIRSDIADASRKARASLGDIKKGATVAFGGVVGDIEDVSGALLAMGPVAGGATAALLATAAAVGGVALAGYEITSALYSAAESTGELADENRALAEAAKEVEQTIGRAMVPTFEGLTLVVIAGTLAVGDFVAKAIDAIGTMKKWYDGLTPFQRGMIDSTTNVFAAMDAVGDLSAGMNDGSISLGGYADRARALVGSLAEVETATGSATGGQRAYNEAVNAGKLAVDEAARAAERLAAIQNEAAQRAWEEDEALTAEILANIAEIDAARSQSLDRQWDQMAANAEQARQQHAEQQAQVVSWATTSIDLAAQVAQAVADGAEEGSRAQKRAALVAFRIQQASALVGVAIDTAAAVTQAIAMFGPPPSPVGMAAMIAAGAIGVTQAALIAAAPPPQAHVGLEIGQPGPVGSRSGLAPDETMVRARRGEEIVPRGAQGSQDPPAVYLRFDHHIADLTDKKRAKQPNNPWRQMINAGRIVGHR